MSSLNTFVQRLAWSLGDSAYSLNEKLIEIKRFIQQNPQQVPSHFSAELEQILFSTTELQAQASSLLNQIDVLFNQKGAKDV